MNNDPLPLPWLLLLFLCPAWTRSPTPTGYIHVSSHLLFLRCISKSHKVGKASNLGPILWIWKLKYGMCWYVTFNLVGLLLTVTTTVIGVEYQTSLPESLYSTTETRAAHIYPVLPMGFKFIEVDATVLIFKIKEVGLRKIK